MVGLTEVKDGKLESTSDILGGMMRRQVQGPRRHDGPQGWRQDVGRDVMDKGKTWNKVYEMTCKK